MGRRSVIAKLAPAVIVPTPVFEPTPRRGGRLSRPRDQRNQQHGCRKGIPAHAVEFVSEVGHLPGETRSDSTTWTGWRADAFSHGGDDRVVESANALALLVHQRSTQLSFAAGVIRRV
jgi:hypothetical protein